MGQSLCSKSFAVSPFPRGEEKKKQLSVRWKGCKAFKWNAWHFWIFISVKAVGNKTMHWFVFSVSLPWLSFPPFHRLWASIRPSTHRRSLSKRSMPGISLYCLCMCVFVLIFLLPEALCVWRVVLAQYPNNKLIKDLIVYSWPCCRVNLVMGKTKHRAAQSEERCPAESSPVLVSSNTWKGRRSQSQIIQGRRGDKAYL